MFCHREGELIKRSGTKSPIGVLVELTNRLVLRTRMVNHALEQGFAAGGVGGGACFYEIGGAGQSGTTGQTGGGGGAGGVDG